MPLHACLTQWVLPLTAACPPAPCSDGREVLFKRHGLDPEAARVLDKALLHKSSWQPLAVDSPKGEAIQAGGGYSDSFLGALLGPEQAAAALDAAQESR